MRWRRVGRKRWGGVEVWRRLDLCVGRTARASIDLEQCSGAVVEHDQVNLCVLEGYIGAAWRIGDRKSCYTCVADFQKKKSASGCER